MIGICICTDVVCTFREAEPWRNILMPWSKSCLILQVFNSKGKDFLQYPPIYSWNLIRMLKHVTHSLFIFREFTCTLKRLDICSREEQVIFFSSLLFLFIKVFFAFSQKNMFEKSHKTCHVTQIWTKIYNTKWFMHYDDICFNTLLNFWYTFKGSGYIYECIYVHTYIHRYMHIIPI